MSDVFIAIFLFIGLILSVIFALTPAYMLLRFYHMREAVSALRSGRSPSKMATFMGFDKEWYDKWLESIRIKPMPYPESMIPAFEPNIPDAPTPTSGDDFDDNVAAQTNYNESRNSEEKPSQGINLH